MRPCAKPTDNTNPCGSEPARDCSVSVNINAGCNGPIASRLAPTVDLRCSHLCVHKQSTRQSGQNYYFSTGLPVYRRIHNAPLLACNGFITIRTEPHAACTMCSAVPFSRRAVAEPVAGRGAGRNGAVLRRGLSINVSGSIKGCFRSETTAGAAILIRDRNSTGSKLCAGCISALTHRMTRR